MYKREDELYIKDIIQAIEKIESYTEGFSFNKFTSDTKTIDAVLRNLSVIGEAANNISEETKEAFKDVPWTEIIGMRNKMIHEYFGVDEEILWKTIKEDLPVLKEQIIKL